MARRKFSDSELKTLRMLLRHEQPFPALAKPLEARLRPDTWYERRLPVIEEALRRYWSKRRNTRGKFSRRAK